MMHKKNLVAAIKVDGKVLRESSGEVQLPFGSEYSVMLKNLDSVRQQAKISIDGKEVGGWLVLNPGETIAVERFFNNGNNNQGNKFKFIERTTGIEEHRGVKLEDGLVTVEFKREKVYPAIIWTGPYNYSYPYYGPTYSTLIRSTGMRSGTGACSAKVEQNEAGITVNGGLSDQRFHNVSDFSCEASEVLTFKLIGKIGEQPIKAGRIVNVKLKCDTCGKKSKTLALFCNKCGTSLQQF